MKIFAMAGIVIAILGIINDLLETTSKLWIVINTLALIFWVIGFLMFVFWYEVTEK